MDWSRLLIQTRLAQPGYQPKPGRPVWSQDADRILFSTPFRRLANKTQVHPLHDHDHIHHRLIHSLETGSVGRSLGNIVGHWLVEAGHVPAGQTEHIAGTVHAACLAHDIGNPPFGHSGEAAIGAWFAQRFAGSGPLFDALAPARHGEFTAFEGNAQGFRLVTRLEMYRNDGGMRLGHAVLGAFSKYPVTEHVQAAEKAAGNPYCGLKKFGVFSTEAAALAEMAEALGLPAHDTAAGSWYARHPLVFLVEAADDICYNILDLEDAFTSGDLPFEEVRALLLDLVAPGSHRAEGLNFEEEIAMLRARAISAAIEAAAEAFITHHDAILAGRFSEGLVARSALGPAFDRIIAVARARIFRAPRKTELEISGRNTLHRVLDGLLPVYEGLMRADWQAGDLGAYELQLVRALGLDLRDIADPCAALHGLADFVSGMTDRYAVKVARMLSGS